jgi:hypothetical protein
MEEENYLQSFVVKPERRRLLRRPSYKWYNIQMDPIRITTGRLLLDASGL